MSDSALAVKKKKKNCVCELFFFLSSSSSSNTNAMRLEAPARSSSNSRCLVTSTAVYCEWQMVIYVGLGSFYFYWIIKRTRWLGKRCLCGEDHFLKANRWLVRRRVIEWTRRVTKKKTICFFIFRNWNNWNGMVLWSGICVVVKNIHLPSLWAPESSSSSSSRSRLRDLMLIMIHTPNSSFHLFFIYLRFIRFIIFSSFSKVPSSLVFRARCASRASN